MVAVGVLAPASHGTEARVDVIVEAEPGRVTAAIAEVRAVGGAPGRHLPIIGGFAASVPAGSVARLDRSGAIRAVTSDATLAPQGKLPGTDYDQTTTATSLYNATKTIGAQEYWRAGLMGEGVDIAVIDTGISRVQGLDTPGKVVDGPDLSFDSQSDARRYLDGYGHGTHLAGIAAGTDGKVDPVDSSSAFVGVAPGARVVNMKVGDSNGVTDVSQVIAAVDWVVTHRDVDGLNIRVVLLAYGTDSTQHYSRSPLAHALENAWKKGVLVVVAAGNTGKDKSGSSERVISPANDPNLFAIGASDPRGTADNDDDDSVAEFSSSSSLNGRTPDLVAPGVSLPSLRVPGSILDTNYGKAGGVGSRFLKGSGTSQAAAVVAGAAALLIQERPGITPDQVKATLMEYAKPLADEGRHTQGQGLIHLQKVRGNPTVTPTASPVWSTGTGRIEAARGSRRPVLDGRALRGERDVMNMVFSAGQLAQMRTTGSTWTGGIWNGSTWTGSSWLGSSWLGSSWLGSSWTGSSWTGSSWTGSSWTGSTWSSHGWTVVPKKSAKTSKKATKALARKVGKR